MRRILVTGGAGFIGSNLCKVLVEDPDNQVIALDNLFTGRIKNLEPLMDRENFTFIQGDVQTMDWDAMVGESQLDQIYNAACPASPPAYQKSPTSTTKTCVLGIINMLELATRFGATLMQFSTSEVYGDPLVHPQVESYHGNVNPIGIRSCYDEGKRCAESLCFDYHREFGTKIKVVRIFNTYGPHMDPQDGRVVSNFIMQALRGEDITVYGEGKQTRSFCYVDDLIRGLILMMNNSREDFLGPVNLGNPGEFNMLELAQMVIEMTGSSSRICHCSLPSDDPTQRKPNIDYAKAELGWAPTILLEEGLRRTIAYFAGRMEREKA